MQPRSKHLPVHWYRSGWRRHTRPSERLRNTAPLAACQRASPILSLLVPEALFFPAPVEHVPGRLVMSGHFHERTRTVSRHDRLYCALVVAHEVCPGHHEHAWRRSDAPFADYGDFLYNPIGIEGWAIYAERAIADVDAFAGAVCNFQIIRRLLPAALTLARLNRGAHIATALLGKIVDECPVLKPEIGMAGRVRDTSLVYAVGLIETERELATLHDRPELGSNWSKLCESYLMQGPITPSSAGRLAAALA
jgi:hypothetical protein